MVYGWTFLYCTSYTETADMLIVYTTSKGGHTRIYVEFAAFQFCRGGMLLEKATFWRNERSAVSLF